MTDAFSHADALHRAGYYFADDAARRHKGWVLVFPLEMLWESNNPLGNDAEKLVRLAQEQWAAYLSDRSWPNLGADSYTAFFAALTQTRSKTSRTISRPVVKCKYPTTTRRYICGNLLLLQEGWQPGGRYELYVFWSVGTPVGERGYHHKLATESMTLVCSGSLPTEA